MESVGSFEPVVALLSPLTLASLIADLDLYEGCLEPGQKRFRELCWRALVAIVGEHVADGMLHDCLAKELD